MVGGRIRLVDAISTRHFGGPGQWLSIVKNFAELHSEAVRDNSPGREQGKFHH
jgi:hypothetical protein